MIDPSEAFCLQAKCKVIYDGRAYSTLQQGNYLILHKSDHSVQIHNEFLIKPVNYQGAGSKLEYKDNILTCINKSEKIEIFIDEIISYSPLKLSPHRISIERTERDLVMKILGSWEDYFEGEFEIIYTEFTTNVGAIDILGVATNKDYYVIEVKRKRASLKECSQLKRYVEFFEEDYSTIGILAAPSITKNAQNYLNKHNFRFLEIGFD